VLPERNIFQAFPVSHRIGSCRAFSAGDDIRFTDIVAHCIFIECGDRRSMPGPVSGVIFGTFPSRIAEQQRIACHRVGGIRERYVFSGIGGAWR
jgi:hypothetical protein